MKRAIILLALLLASCGGDDDSARGSPSDSGRSGDGASPQPAGAKVEGPSPIEFTFLGLSDDKASIHYRIKVVSSKEIEQVDVDVNYLDKAGKSIDHTTVIWQNIVKSQRQPIVAGQTYDVLDYAYPDTAKVEGKLLRVVFKDLSYWEAPK